MTVTSGFFNSVNHDRKYNAEEISSIFDGIILDGVYQGFGEAFKVEGTSTANQVKIGTGRAWFNHTWTLNDEALYLTLPAPNSTYPRIDAIVLEVNNSSSVRANTIKYISGSAASSPAKPSLTNTTDVHQYPLAYITRPKATTTISAGNIENKIGTSECPIVIGVLESLNDDRYISQVVANLTTDFNTWFEGIKGQLSGDVAANLANKISELNSNINTNKILVYNFYSRGKRLLGTSITDEQQKHFSNPIGYFYPGDYWIIGDYQYIIVDVNPYLNINEYSQEHNKCSCDVYSTPHILISTNKPIKKQVNEIVKFVGFDDEYANSHGFVTVNAKDYNYNYATYLDKWMWNDLDKLSNYDFTSQIESDLKLSNLTFKTFPTLTNDMLHGTKYIPAKNHQITGLDNSKPSDINQSVISLSTYKLYYYNISFDLNNSIKFDNDSFKRPFNVILGNPYIKDDIYSMNESSTFKKHKLGLLKNYSEGAYDPILYRYFSKEKLYGFVNRPNTTISINDGLYSSKLTIYPFSSLPYVGSGVSQFFDNAGLITNNYFNEHALSTYSNFKVEANGSISFSAKGTTYTTTPISGGKYYLYYYMLNAGVDVKTVNQSRGDYNYSTDSWIDFVRMDGTVDANIYNVSDSYAYTQATHVYDLTHNNYVFCL